MKYVMFTNVKTGIRLPVLLPETIVSHADASLGKDWVATSAGFYDTTKHETFNKSVSLRIGPLEEDAAILNAVLLGAESSLMLLQDPTESAQLLNWFCKCGHSHEAHRAEHDRGSKGTCAIHGCDCMRFERCV